MLELSLREARRLALGAQLLAGPPPKRPTKALMRATVQHLGAVQIDTINVVARSHHLVLWSRLGNHRSEWLNELLSSDRAIFEYWAHAAAYVPIELFPYFRPAMLDRRNADAVAWNAAAKRWLRENSRLLAEVEEHIRANGAVAARSFDPPEGAQRPEAWSWYGNKPTNLALDMLWTMGVLMIDRRENFQRWYDLTERVYPTWDDAKTPTADEQRRVLAEQALRAMGLTTARWLPDYFRTNWTRSISPAAAKAALDELVERGLATPAKVEGLRDPVFVCAPLLQRRIPPSRTTLLSPFDSLVWDRRRTLDLFQFEVVLECYVPAAKRRYGYFSLQVLYRDQLVGRLDPKAERKTRQLRVKALHLEPWFAPRADERFYRSLASTLSDFAAFNGCETVVVEGGGQTEPAALLRRALLSPGAKATEPEPLPTVS
jgi:uncharacterized protein YcaQ